MDRKIKSIRQLQAAEGLLCGALCPLHISPRSGPLGPGAVAALYHRGRSNSVATSHSLVVAVPVGIGGSV